MVKTNPSQASPDNGDTDPPRHARLLTGPHKELEALGEGLNAPSLKPCRGRFPNELSGLIHNAHVKLVIVD